MPPPYPSPSDRAFTPVFDGLCGGGDAAALSSFNIEQLRPIRERPMPAYELVSHHLCPYVQRAAIVLLEKGVPFRRTLIDLDNKPDWFKAISPLGKVPLLKVTLDDGETAVLFE